MNNDIFGTHKKNTFFNGIFYHITEVIFQLIKIPSGIFHFVDSVPKTHQNVKG